jgi:hypothetical protein
MIENIRKNIVLVFVVIVVLLIGFIFMDTSGFLRQSAQGANFATVDGRSYTEADFNKIGLGPLRLAGGLQSYDANGLEIMRFTNLLVGNARDPDAAALQFFGNRLMIQKAREEFGVHPPHDTIAEFIRGLSVFQTQPNPGAAPGSGGEFDQAKYNEFVQRRLGRHGLVENDFQRLIGDVIATRELRRIIGGGLPGPRWLAEAKAVVNSQTVEAEVAEIDSAAFRDRFDPSEEELREYWETQRDAYKTDRRIQISYVLVSPEIPEELEAADDAGEESEGETEEPDENAAEESNGETEEEKSAREEAERLAARKAIEREVAKSVDQFITTVEESEGAQFEPLAEKNGWTLATTGWITRDTLPPDLQLDTRGASAHKEIADFLFELAEGPGPLAAYTTAIAVGENQWLMARLDDLEEVREKTFEEAREEVREDYIAEKVDEAVRAEAEAKTEALREAVENGADFEEAAAAEDLEARTIGPWSNAESLPGEPNSGEIFERAAATNPGEFTDPLHLEDRVLLIRVVSREIVKDDNRNQMVDSQASNLEVRNENAAFAAWLSQSLETGGIESRAIR